MFLGSSEKFETRGRFEKGQFRDLTLYFWSEMVHMISRTRVRPYKSCTKYVLNFVKIGMWLKWSGWFTVSVQRIGSSWRLEAQQRRIREEKELCDIAKAPLSEITRSEGRSKFVKRRFMNFGRKYTEVFSLKVGKSENGKRIVKPQPAEETRIV